MIKSPSVNPFSSSIYESVWLNHFNQNKKALKVNAIDGIKFIKHNYFPYLINVGTNTTNGMAYCLNLKALDFKSGVYLIHDVPDYFGVENENDSKKLKLKKVRQYAGFATNLDGVNNLDDFLKNKFSSSSRKHFRRSFKRLELCCDIAYKTYYDTLPKEEYDSVLEQFKGLIKKRYDALKIDVTLIDRWPFFEDLLYPMILERKAAIFAIYSAQRPISMSLVFLNDDTLFNAVKAFDADYYKFNIGHLDISKIFEWCFDNKISTIDFSKGEYEYKTRWTNVKYHYDCHIVYDSGSFFATTTAFLLSKYFWLKQYLRDLKVNLLYSKIRYTLKNLFTSNKTKKTFTVETLQENETHNLRKEIDFMIPEFSLLKRIILDILYANSEPMANLKVYEVSIDKKAAYLVIGDKNKCKIQFS